MVAEIDLANNGKINYSEFIAATVDPVKYLTDEKCLAIFKSFDVDNTGEITAVNLQDSFTKFGMQISDAEIKEIMSAHDEDGGMSIDLKEFTEMIKPANQRTTTLT